MITSLVLLSTLGEQIKRLRLRANIDQQSLADNANVSVTALKNVESGNGATLHTFIAVLRALGKEEWLSTLSPEVSISPMAMISKRSERKRASKVSKIHA